MKDRTLAPDSQLEVWLQGNIPRGLGHRRTDLGSICKAACGPALLMAGWG